MSNKKPILIGICGLKGSGKSEVATRLAANLEARRVRFATPLKDMLRALGLNEDEIEGHLKEESCDKLCGQTPRHAMLTLGTEWGREMIGGDIWVRAWSRGVRDAMGDGRCVVTEDLRFPNEYQALIEAGGIVLRVVRPGVQQGTHESEAHAMSFASHIECYNDGDLDDLRHWIDSILPGEIAVAVQRAEAWSGE